MRLFLLTGLTLLAFAANSVLNRMAVGPGLIGPVEFAAIRLASGAVMLGGLLVVRRRRADRPRWPGLAGRGAGVGGLLVYLFGFSFAYLGLDAGTGALVLFGAVQVTMFAGALLAGEAVPARRWAGAALALAGLALVALPGASAPPVVPVLLMAGAGLGWGVYSLSGRGAADPLAATAWNFLLAVPFAGGLALAAGIQAPAAQGVVLAAISGAVTSGLGYALWYALLPRLGAARAAVAQLSVPVLAALGGAVLIAEAPGWRFAAASLLVLGGVALASLDYRVFARR